MLLNSPEQPRDVAVNIAKEVGHFEIASAEVFVEERCQLQELAVVHGLEALEPRQKGCLILRSHCHHKIALLLSSLLNVQLSLQTFGPSELGAKPCYSVLSLEFFLSDLFHVHARMRSCTGRRRPAHTWQTVLCAFANAAWSVRWHLPTFCKTA